MRRVVFVITVLLLLTVNANAALLDLMGIGATATASRVYNSSVASKAIDGDYDTQWVAPSQGSIANPDWLLVDLKSLYDIDKVMLTGTNSELYSSLVNINYELYYSQDGNNWDLGKSGNLSDDPVLYQDTVFLNNVPVQYLRYDVTGGNGNNVDLIHWSHLTEMAVYGVPNTPSNAVPEPASVLLLGLGGVGMLLRKFRQKNV